MKRCILDVDGILWPFHVVLSKTIKEMYGKSFTIWDMTSWNWYEGHLTEKEFWAAVDHVHLEEQLSTEPFVLADKLMETLDKKKYEIIVASHRRKGSAAGLSAWLMLYMPDVWNGLYSGPDKTFLIDSNCLVIDDNPSTIEYADKAGAMVATLEYPWNRGMTSHSFKTMRELVEWVKST